MLIFHKCSSILLLLPIVLAEIKLNFPPNNCPTASPANAVPALPGEFPYMFAIGWKSKTNESEYVYKCGGSLIHNTYVLTAAHCLYDSDDMPVVVRAGGDGLSNTFVEIIRIREIIEHPEYEYPSTYNDIALLKLFDNKRDQIARLADSDVRLNENLTAIGYGDTKFGGAPTEKLLKVFVSAVSKKDCSKYYEPDASVLHNGIMDTQICAGDPIKFMDTCQGDSGGPLIRREVGIHYIMGITSFGIGCGNGPPGVYTSVKPYVGWIDSVIRPWYNEEFPYMFGLHWLNHTSCKYLPEKCGAVQISWTYLLIAAHCLYEFEEIPIFFRAGGYNLKYTKQIYWSYENSFIHPDYKHPLPYHDIAVIQSGWEPFSVTPIWLKDTLKNNTLTYVNYADTNLEEFSRQDLLKTTLNYVPNEKCSQIYQNDYFGRNFSNGIVSTHLCANDTQKLWDLDQGYADGPLIMHTDIEGVATPHLVGITTFGVNCETCPPAVFTRISKYIDWIEQIVWPKEKKEEERIKEKI